MRNTYRIASAVILVLALAMPAGAASRPSGPSGILQVIKRYVIKAASRLMPPVGAPLVEPPPPPPEENTTTTDAPITTQ